MSLRRRPLTSPWQSLFMSSFLLPPLVDLDAHTDTNIKHILDEICLVLAEKLFVLFFHCCFNVRAYIQYPWYKSAIIDLVSISDIIGDEMGTSSLTLLCTTHLLSLSPQGGPIQNMESQRCLELVESKQSEFTFQLAIQDCTDQKWTITNILTVLPQWTHGHQPATLSWARKLKWGTPRTEKPNWPRTSQKWMNMLTQAAN